MKAAKAMKYLLITLVISASTLGLSYGADQAGDLFNEHVIIRDFNSNPVMKVVQLTEIPEEIQNIQTVELDELLDFATQYNLFEIGFSYEVHKNTFAINDASGEPQGYTFSIIISKNDTPMTRFFYQVAKRVDGVFYVGRTAAYDLR
jgi:hypothetical protein